MDTENNYINKHSQIEFPNKIYPENRYCMDHSPNRIYVPNKFIMIKLIKSCIDVEKIEDLWINQLWNRFIEILGTNNNVYK